MNWAELNWTAQWTDAFQRETTSGNGQLSLIILSPIYLGFTWFFNTKVCKSLHGEEKQKQKQKKNVVVFPPTLQRSEEFIVRLPRRGNDTRGRDRRRFITVLSSEFVDIRGHSPSNHPSPLPSTTCFFLSAAFIYRLGYEEWQLPSPGDFFFFPRSPSNFIFLRFFFFSLFFLFSQCKPAPPRRPPTSIGGWQGLARPGADALALRAD